MFGLIPFGITFPEILIMKRVKYKVIPIGINTTIPAIKLLRIRARKGFLIFGLPSPLFWGVLMTLFALIPVLGPWVIWAPASLFMLIQGISQDSSSLILKAIGLFIYGAIIVSTSDNILRPKLVGDKAKVHPILILIGTIGGLVVFGPIGVIFGPLVLSLTSVIFEVYVKRKSV